jgi:VanZ family protein
MALIFGASSLSDPGTLPPDVSDKTVHVIAYGVLGALLVRALAGGRIEGVTWPRALVAVVLATLYGVSDEVHQRFVPGRSPDTMDVLADAAGAAAAAALLVAARAVFVRARRMLGSSP